MDTIPVCPSCGKPLSPDAPKGLCAECLMKGAFATGTDASQGDPAQTRPSRFVPPKPEELAARFPQLDILEFIGQGGMGAVYKARQKQLDRVVALKILPPQSAGDLGFASRFAREAQALAKLNHPFIVTLYEFGQSDGLFYFLMEYVDGINLQQLLHAGRIAPGEALAIVPQICEALQFAHQRGIVHRDIKPGNILLSKEGVVKIADFGIAKIVGNDSPETTDGKAAPQPATELTGAGSILGTPQYMAPEQVSNPQEVDHRADIYSLGVVFYQMLTGELPTGKFVAPSRKVSVDVRLDEVVLRALEKQPDSRYQQVSELKLRVETIASQPQQAGKSPAPPVIATGFSRKAIAGAWCVFPLFFFLLFIRPFAPFSIFMVLAAGIGASVYGARAIREIRASAGKIRGLRLAVFDFVLLPIILLDVVIFALLASMPGRMDGWRFFWHFVISVLVDIAFLREVWRKAKQPEWTWKFRIRKWQVATLVVLAVLAVVGTSQRHKRQNQVWEMEQTERNHREEVIGNTLIFETKRRLAAGGFRENGVVTSFAGDGQTATINVTANQDNAANPASPNRTLTATYIGADKWDVLGDDALHAIHFTISIPGIANDPTPADFNDLFPYPITTLTFAGDGSQISFPDVLAVLQALRESAEYQEWLSVKNDRVFVISNRASYQFFVHVIGMAKRADGKLVELMPEIELRGAGGKLVARTLLGSQDARSWNTQFYDSTGKDIITRLEWRVDDQTQKSFIERLVFDPGTPQEHEWRGDSSGMVQVAPQAQGIANAAYTVQASGSAPLSYQWYFNPTNVTGAMAVTTNTPVQTSSVLIPTNHPGSFVASTTAMNPAAAESQPNQEVLAVELLQAKRDLARAEQLFKNGVLSGGDYETSKDKVEILKAETTGDPVQIAKANLAAAQRQLQNAEKLHSVGMIGTADYEAAKDKVELLEAKLHAASYNRMLENAVTKRIFVTGAVHTPGPQDLGGDEIITVSKAILHAGGFTADSDTHKVRVTRNATSSASAGNVIVVNVGEILDKGIATNDVVLEPGDRVMVPERTVRF